MNRPSYKELWLDERKDRDEQLQWIRDAVDGNAKFCSSEPPYSEEEELARQVMTMHTRIAELEGLVDELIEAGDWGAKLAINLGALSGDYQYKLAKKRYDKWDALVKDWKERER